MRGNSLLYLLLFLISAFSCFSKVSRTKYIPPVVLIPGDGGSQIEAKLDKPSIIHYICQKKSDYWFDLWLNMELLLPVVIDCWVDNMRLLYDNVTRTTMNSPGVQTRIPGFGNTSTVEWLDPSQRSPTGYFKDIVNAMIPLGYERGVTVRGAPFDFRRAPNEHSEYFIQLRQLIEETYQYTGQKIVLLVHSMGAPMTQYFLNHLPQDWKDRYIETMVSLAGAWGGSVKAVKVYTAGDNLGIYVISAAKVRAEQRSAPSLAFLLPSDELWGPNETIVETPTKNYSAADFKELFEDLNLPDAYNMYLDTKDLLRNAPAPGLELHCLHGEGVDTVEKLIYPSGKFPDSPAIINGGGDGTVNTRSAQVCLKWADKQKYKIHYKTFKGVDHMQILRDKGSISYVVELLSNITVKNERQAKMKMINLENLEKRKDKEFLRNYAINGRKREILNMDENKLASEDSKRHNAITKKFYNVMVQDDGPLLGKGL
ncbi:lysosomal phospholipase A and acyltransferase isoform X1 [Procambarus clarkii]|uniref:lysosomal phospholipase A and acyltransferase isoform X1 n=2 Tax=Procambarus clarkii TaxID=6728 RepID=UPI0037447729